MSYNPGFHIGPDNRVRIDYYEQALLVCGAIVPNVGDVETGPSAALLPTEQLRLTHQSVTDPRSELTASGYALDLINVFTKRATSIARFNLGFPGVAELIYNTTHRASEHRPRKVWIGAFTQDTGAVCIAGYLRDLL